MELTRFEDPAAFEERALPWLMRREAEHNLIIGLTARLRRGEYPEGVPYLAVFEEDGDVAACALRTPGAPNQLLLSNVGHPDAVDAIARDHHQFCSDLRAVLAEPEASHAFVDRWRELTGRSGSLRTRQGIHECSNVKQPDGVSGRMRAARGDDLDLLAEWWAAFVADVGEEPVDIAEAREWIESRLSSDTAGFVVWEDGGPVSLAGYSGPTPNGIRVAPVYTPPELRGRGYASACVAGLTQRLLDEGRRFVFLYTDLANPTSNKIYRTVGYELVREVEQHRFD